ncbi:MAG: globin-coupled sensor protein [Haloarculaceae archaeon]
MSSGEPDVVDETRRRQVDGAQLTDEIGIDEREIAWRKEFTGFAEADAERMARMDDTLERIADDLVEEFYDHLEDHERAVDIFGRSTKSVEQLKRTQRGYLIDLGQGEYGQSYFDRRARIGKIHDMLELGPRIYLGAYSIYYEGILEAIAADVKSEIAAADGGAAVDDTAETGSGAADGATGAATVDEAIDEVLDRTMSALKLLNLDQQVAMDTYIHSYSERLEGELERQQSVASEVDEAVARCQVVAEDLETSSQEISDLADVQAGSTNDVAEEVSNMSATIEEIASTADEVESTSDRAEHLAEEGQAAADEAIDAMEAVDASAASVADDVDRLDERVGEIDEVVEVINDIAEQTNVLALNASIEAARAGEAGDGFAVVADEVKELAEESQEHASRIESMVAEIQADTADTVESLAETTEQVDEGIDRVEAAMDRLEDIVAAVRETSQGIREVSDATDDQAASTEEVASMLDDLVEQAERIADEVEEVARANERQAEQVVDINDTVERLTD